MHAYRVAAGVLASTLTGVACGDSGGRDTASASATDSNATPATPATTTPTPTDTGVSASQTDDDDGTNSNSQGNTTAGTTMGVVTATGPTSTGPDLTTSGTTQSTSTTQGTNTLTDPSTGTSTGDPCEGGGGLEFSYLWVANTSEGSISKINTETLMEEGRYYADPNPPAASSSRTSVNIDGHYVVVSNRGTGTVSKFAANITDCVDKNGNGTIETSQNGADLLPWGTDECLLWNTAVNPPPDSYTHGPRGTAWAPGDFNQQTCEWDNQRVWVGWMSAPGLGHMGSFDGETGQQLDTVDLPNWSLNVNYAPYGAAADGAGHVWFTAVYEELARIDTTTLELKRWPGGGIQFYGMTVDGKGNPWFGPYNNGNVAYFDAATETFHEIPGTNENHRGVAVDGGGMVWVASNPGGTHGCGLNQIDSNTNTFVQFHTFPQCGTPVGVSIDVDGYVWMVDYSGWAYRIDPNTYEKSLVMIPGDHYTYSDMTGGGLVGAVMPG
ncbi:MAG: lyase [Myxococcales bacterium]|nr:lyase [Myxococcales bacterium]